MAAVTPGWQCPSMATPCADPRSRYFLPFSSYSQQPAPLVMTTSPRRAVVPPRIRSSTSACFICLGNVSPCAFECTRDGGADAAIGKDHRADAFVDRLDRAHDLFLHAAFGEFHEPIRLAFRNLRNQRRLVRKPFEQAHLIG